MAILQFIRFFYIVHVNDAAIRVVDRRQSFNTVVLKLFVLQWIWLENISRSVHVL